MNHSRLLFLVALASSWFLALGARLYQVQIVNHEHYRGRAERQQNRVVALTPPRGTIYDRRGHELAVSVKVESVAADATQIEDGAATARELAALLDLDAGELAADLGSGRGFVWVKRKIDAPTAEAVRELDLAGIFLLPESKRYYPLARLAAQVLGYVGTDNSGLGGLEYLYDPVVASEPGKRTVVRDARYGTVLYPDFEIFRGRPGQDLFLTLDATVQHLVEHELEKAVRETRAASGMAVIMEADTGAVLAMASYPTFDPGSFAAYSAQRRRNPAVMDAFEPGSTFKMITLAAALEAGVVEPQDVFDCEMGAIRFGRTLIKDHHPFGMLTVRQIITKSSNVGAIKLGQAAGRERFHHTIEAFGFGRPTGIDLPSESAGILRPLAKWSPLTPHYISFGQGLSVTAVQLTAAFATIANGGRLLEPYVVAEIGRPGEPDYTVHQRKVVRLPISPSSVRQIRGLLEGVVDEGGTATAAAIPGYPAAGKTGTAEKAVPGAGYSATDHVASFIGFAPAQDPVLVAAVILDGPKPRYHGGEVAAPVFKAIVEKSLLYLGVRPRREPPVRWPGEADADVPRIALASTVEPVPSIEPAGPIVAGSGQRRSMPPGTVPDFAGLSARQAVQHSSRLGLRLALNGHGAVMRQVPPPGTPLEKAGGRVELWLTAEAM